MTTRERNTVSRLLDVSARAIRDEWGRGWDSLGHRLQKALLAEGFLYLAAQQDESVPADVVVELVEDAWIRLVELGA